MQKVVEKINLRTRISRIISRKIKKIRIRTRRTRIKTSKITKARTRTNRTKNKQQPKDKMSKDNAEQLSNAAMQQEKATQQRISKAMQQAGSKNCRKIGKMIILY